MSKLLQLGPLTSGRTNDPKIFVGRIFCQNCALVIERIVVKAQQVLLVRTNGAGKVVAEPGITLECPQCEHTNFVAEPES